jgi:hypothetical protein
MKGKGETMTTENKHNEGPWCNTCHGYTHMPWCARYEERLLTTIIPTTPHEQLLADTLRLVQRLLRNQLDCSDALCRSCDDARRTVLATITEVLGGEVERREGVR